MNVGGRGGSELRSCHYTLAWVTRVKLHFKKKKRKVVLIHNGVLLSHKKNEKLSFATTWIELEDIMLSEISLTQKDELCMFSLICGS